jgi:hypothetical protein
MATEFDGMIALNDAGVREQESQAKIAQMMAETALIWQKVQHAGLKNLEMFLKIKWDAQAHDNLHRLVLQAQRRADELRKKADKFKEKIQWMNRLLDGGEASQEGIRQGWLAFYFIRNAMPPSALVKAYKAVTVPDEIYEETSWAHPWHRDGAVTHIYVGHKDPTQLFGWAAKNNYYPVFSEPAWDYITTLLVNVDDIAEEMAANLDAKVKEAEAKALEISKIDWNRLNTPIQEDASAQDSTPGDNSVQNF